MKTSTSAFHSCHICILAIVMAALTGTINSLDFTYYFGNGAFRDDYFRHFLFTVIPIIDGTGSLSLLFVNHHASPLLHLHQIITSYALNCSLRVDAYIGIAVFFVMAVYLSVTAFWELSLRTGSQFYALIIAISIGLVMTGLTAVEPISWPLIYLQGYFLCLGLLVSISTYLLCARPQAGKHMALYVGSVFLAILLHTSFGILFFMASVPVVALRAISQRNYKVLALLLGTGAFVFIWNTFLLPSFGQLVARDAGDSMRNIAAHFAEIPLIAAAFGRAIAAGFHGDAYAYAVDKEAPMSWQMVGFICVAMAYAVATLWALLAQRRVLIAGVIMLAIWLGAMAALFSRGNGTYPLSIDAPRYILLYKFAAASFLWSGGDALGSLFKFIVPGILQGIRNFLLPVTALILLGSIIGLQIEAFAVMSQRKASLVTDMGWNELSVYMLGVDPANTFSLQHWQSGNNGLTVSAPVIDWLARNEVNVFSQYYRGSQHLTDYKQGRSIYQSSREAPRQFEMDQKNCIQHPGFTDKQAWNANIESSISGSFSFSYPTTDRPPLTYFIRPGIQNIYGTLAPDMPFHLCFPVDVTVKWFTYLSALDTSG